VSDCQLARSSAQRSETRCGYDAAGRLLTDQKQDAEANILYSNTYVYDALGNRTSHTDLNGVTTYQYNGLNQLCMVQYPNGNQVTYAYDANGNRTAKSEGGDILQAYAYDFENHMVQASGPNGILGTYYYNADGLRVAKVTASGTTGFLYDGAKLLQEVGSTGQTTATYTSTGGTVNDPLVGIANSAGSHVPLMDGLGSTRFLLDNTQNVSDGYVYEAFGRQVSGSGETPNPYHFVGAYGYYEDWETGLALLTARYYDAEVGRFVTRDPIGFGGGDWNVYGYVGGNPTLDNDASGLLSVPPWVITGGGALVTAVKRFLPIYKVLSAVGCAAVGVYTVYLIVECIYELKDRLNLINRCRDKIPDDWLTDIKSAGTVNYLDCASIAIPALKGCISAVIGYVIDKGVRPPGGAS
jgi:RHS repeat-associated protein